MKITNVKVDKLKLELIKPITVALGTIEHVESLILKVETDEGISGIGEGAPFEFVTGETLETSLYVARMLGNRLIGEDPLAIERIHHLMDKTIIGNSAAKAAIDIALYDLHGKWLNTPLYKILGGYSNTFITDMTIGIDQPEVMAQEAKEKAEIGFSILKIKAGNDPEHDIEAVKLIRQAVGNRVRLRMDANQGWTSVQAIRVIREVDQYRVDAIEQPLAYWDIDGMKYVRNKTSIPIMADESVHSPIDAVKIIKQNAADMINIKLMKSAGLYKAVAINNIAEAAGVPCMVGCMLESKIGITAGASLVAAKRNIMEADMDSFLYIKETGISGGLSLQKGVITLSEEPGLGITINI
ncbi:MULTISPECIES: mandelate racemase/muconate lactonizing enzyme family protein [unclassified Virgibacillus]|uniref:mandelate racemase/muconate lactonizing enzyme family protein n=1 Tax=unclassified Virgibacillus TaxID=2620237 RepID=UPI000909AB44|nr:MULTISPECIES: dipeptide epimerase [unclassified Virgibacillus]API93186.1 dipeptide epimerase [Virgibacillus sp. 6R]MBS7428770.1 dipeptide epimerase [Virgibacillus sp. 19R1-5]